MRVLFSSNAPWSATGYGVQTKHILRGIRDAGHPVACIAWWGLQGGGTTWEGIPMFPSHFDSYGNDATPHYVRKWRADLLITLIDLWVLDPGLGHLGHTRWAPYIPIDHANPIPKAITDRFPHAHRIIVYSRYAEREIAQFDGGRYKDRLRYVPHGVDCALFQPAIEGERESCRRRLYGDWPEDAYIVGMVAANKAYPCRKSFPEAFEAFAVFAARHPEARLYLHSFHGVDFRGPDLQQLAQQFGIIDRVRFANPQMLLGGEYDDETMHEIYASMDVLLAPSQGEGFGLPIIEAQANGIPVITTDHSAMSELCGIGWRVPPLRLTPSLLGGRFAEADVQGIVHALEESYRRPRGPQWAELAHNFARQYDWRRVIPQWTALLAELDGGRREMALELEGGLESAHR